MPHKTIIRLSGVARNPANGFPARPLACMLGIADTGALITGWERSRRRKAVAAERRISEENLQLQQQTQQAELAALEERSRIAREIHDGVAQSLYMLNVSLETCVELPGHSRRGPASTPAILGGSVPAGPSGRSQLHI